MTTKKTPARKSVAKAATATRGKYTVPVVRSTFQVLEELSRAGTLDLKDLTARTRLSKSTIFRILSTLVELGYVVRDSGRSYQISPQLGQLVTEEAASETLRRLALPLMLKLRDQYGETVNLGIRQLDKVTYLEVVPSEFALRLQESRGASVPVHASALGKAILAFTPAEEVDDLIRGNNLEAVTENTISQPTEFLSELRKVRNANLAFDRGEGSLLAICIGVPILDHRGRAIAAMSISGPASRFNPKRDAAVIASLQSAAAEISGSIGKRPQAR